MKSNFKQLLVCISTSNIQYTAATVIHD